jgi:K+-sensing histidine kinase KdpD
VGLAICRAIVDANGGSIAIEDGASGGARVVVTLPVRHG